MSDGIGAAGSRIISLHGSRNTNQYKGFAISRTSPRGHIPTAAEREGRDGGNVRPSCPLSSFPSVRPQQPWLYLRLTSDSVLSSLIVKLQLPRDHHILHSLRPTSSWRMSEPRRKIRITGLIKVVQSGRKASSHDDMALILNGAG